MCESVWNLGSYFLPLNPAWRRLFLASWEISPSLLWSPQCASPTSRTHRACPAALQRRGGHTHRSTGEEAPGQVSGLPTKPEPALYSCPGSWLRLTFCSQTADPMNPDRLNQIIHAPTPTAKCNGSLELDLYHKLQTMQLCYQSTYRAPVYMPKATPTSRRH